MKIYHITPIYVRTLPGKIKTYIFFAVLVLDLATHVKVCGNDFLIPSYSHRIIPIPTLTHSYSNTTFPFPFFPITSIPIPIHSGSDHKAEKYVYCLREFKTKYEVTA